MAESRQFHHLIVSLKDLPLDHLLAFRLDQSKHRTGNNHTCNMILRKQEILESVTLVGKWIRYRVRSRDCVLRFCVTRQPGELSRGYESRQEATSGLSLTLKLMLLDASTASV